jgi:imidazolonepropionase-like amidohydrolase
MANVKRSRSCRNLRASVMRLTPARATAALLLAVALMTPTGVPLAHADAPEVYAIRDARIITGTGRVIAKGTVVIRDGLIAGVGENERIPADARVIDGAGLTVYPGLIDGYTSLGLASQAQAQRGGRAAGQPAVATPGAPAAPAQPPQPEQALGDPSVAAADLVRADGSPMEDARSVGVTSALISPRQGIFAGQTALINLAGGEPSDLVLRAPVALTVQFTTATGFFGLFPNSLMGTVAFIRQTFYDAVDYRNKVERYNRTKRGVPRPEYDRKLAALQPALKGELPVLFVANSDGDIRRALMIADEFKLKPMIAGAMYGYRVADMLKTRNVPVILSLDFPRRSADLPEDESESLRVLRERAETRRGPAALAQAGVRFAFTSGTLRPQDFIASVQTAIDNGLSKDEALRALTVNAAEIFGVADQLGTIEEGKIANLVVTSGDLLARDARIRHVFIDGSEVELRRPEPPAQRGGRTGRADQPAAGPAADPSGEWDMVIRTTQGDINGKLSLRREGEQINGTITTHAGSFAIQNAAVRGNQLRFSVSLQMGGDTMQASVTGTIEGDTMRGMIVMPALGSFEFTGSRPR